MSSLSPALRYVKTTANATVDHLSKYLALRIALEERQTDQPAEEPGVGETASGGEGSRAGPPGRLLDISEKQYTIYITTSSGQFSVSTTNQADVMHYMNFLLRTFFQDRSEHRFPKVRPLRLCK